MGRATSIIDAIRRTDALTGVERVVEVTRLVLTNSIRSLRCNGSSRPTQRCPSVLTGARGGVQDRYIDCFERLFELEAAATSWASTPAVSRSP